MKAILPFFSSQNPHIHFMPAHLPAWKHRILTAMGCPEISSLEIWALSGDVFIQQYVYGELKKRFLKPVTAHTFTPGKTTESTVLNDLSGTHSDADAAIFLLGDFISRDVLRKSISDYAGKECAIFTVKDAHQRDAIVIGPRAQIHFSMDGVAAYSNASTHTVIDSNVFVIKSSTDAAAAKRWLKSTMARKGDGFVATWVNRPISKTLSWWLVKWDVHPNWITAFTILIGVLGAMGNLFADPLMVWLGAGLFYLSSVLDGCDGEVARLGFRESRFGQWFDNIGDCFVVTLYLLSLGIGAWVNEGSTVLPALSVLGFVSIWGGLLVLFSDLKRRGAGSLSVIFKDMTTIQNTRARWLRLLQIFYRREYLTVLVTCGVISGLQQTVIVISSINSILFMIVSIFIGLTHLKKQQP